MAANEKKVLCTIIVRETDLYRGGKTRTAHVDVEAKSVSIALQQAQERAMAQLKGKC